MFAEVVIVLLQGNEMLALTGRKSVDKRTWVCQCKRLPSCPLLDLQERQLACERDKPRFMYARVDDAELSRLISQRVLRVFSLQVIDAVNTLLVQYNESLVPRPAKPDNLALVPLCMLKFALVSAQNDIMRNGVSTHTLKSRTPSPAGE